MPLPMPTSLLGVVRAPIPNSPLGVVLIGLAVLLVLGLIYAAFGKSPRK
jgi:hypothetical protein